MTLLGHISPTGGWGKAECRKIAAATLSFAKSAEFTQCCCQGDNGVLEQH